MRHIDFGIIDQLDKDLYDKFLDIKGFYNKFAPFEKDLQIASSIENDLTVFFVEFKEKYKNAVSEDFIRLLGLIKTMVDRWRAEMMSKDELSIQVGTLPITMGPIPHIFNTVVQNKTHDANDTIFNQSITNNRTVPEGNDNLIPQSVNYNVDGTSDMNEKNPGSTTSAENNYRNVEESPNERNTVQINFKDNINELKAVKSIIDTVDQPHNVERGLRDTNNIQNKPVKLDIAP